jgi:predicted nucleic acid-binding protein
VTNLNRRIVLDASALVHMLTDAGPAGEWARMRVADTRLAAPDYMPVEAANILRRHALAGIIDSTAATLAHEEVVTMPVELHPYARVAERAWELRHNLTIYDATYVALAELLGVPLVTLEVRMAHATGPRCGVLAYGDN